jgi:hypothetical protein
MRGNKEKLVREALMKRKSKLIFAVIALFLLTGCVDVDDSGDGITGPAGINYLAADYNGNEIGVVMVLDDLPDDKTKYRVHLDYKDMLATDFNPNCLTTSDDTMIIRRHRGDWKSTGPGEIGVFPGNNAIAYIISVGDEIDVNPGDTVLIWADTQYKGIADRAPDTESSDGCSKPQNAGEVLTLLLPTPPP